MSQYYNSGQSLTFTAAATGNPTPTLQWQYSVNGGSSWCNLSGATSTPLHRRTARPTSRTAGRFGPCSPTRSGSATSQRGHDDTWPCAPAVTTQPVSQYLQLRAIAHLHGGGQRHPDSHRAVAVLGERWELRGPTSRGPHRPRSPSDRSTQLREPLGASGRVHQLGRLGAPATRPR